MSRPPLRFFHRERTSAIAELELHAPCPVRSESAVDIVRPLQHKGRTSRRSVSCPRNFFQSPQHNLTQTRRQQEHERGHAGFKLRKRLRRGRSWLASGAGWLSRDVIVPHTVHTDSRQPVAATTRKERRLGPSRCPSSELFTRIRLHVNFGSNRPER